MYKKRLLSRILNLALRQFPAVLLTGPRQSGKTTFLSHELAGRFSIVSFDDPLSRNFARQDPNGFLDQFKGKPVMLDEIQYVADILPYIKMRIDASRQDYGKWVLTGSQQFALMQNISESLAGRIALLELLPFNQEELRHAFDKLADYVWTGAYPEPALQPAKRDLWISSYIQTYLERDIRLLHNVQDLHVFELFVATCAARHGQTFNKADVAREIGIAEPTVKAWGSLLSASYITHLLPPYFRNYSKRLIKSPKLYFIDSSLVCALTRQPDAQSALAGQMGGALFEGLIVSETIKAFTHNGKRADCYYWRSHDGMEVDLLVQVQGKYLPVEIKLTSTPTLKHIQPLNKFKTLAGKDASATGILVCRTRQKIQMPDNNIALPWHQYPKYISELIGK
jgi:predicted AAA+ superfamily ATPase